MSTLRERRASRESYTGVVKTSRPGEGKRFQAIVEAARLAGAKNPEAVAAAIGRKKYGKKQMTKWSVAGRKQKSK